MTKYVFLTGGVVSGLGKGITAASLGKLLKARGYKVTISKIDPYFNVDSSNLSPYQHGEIFVTDDGSEVDLVVGHYERILDENLGQGNDVTSGKIYSSVIAKERQGKYNGGTVQVVPHITDEIKAHIRALDNDNVDIIITEIGGTAGDIECHPFLEAIRQFQSEIGRTNVAYIHVTLLPYIEMSGEQKTKPTQHSVKELQNVGIQPDVIVCRSEYEIDLSSKKKLSLFCNVSQDCIIQNLSQESIYTIPLMLEEEGFASVVLRKLRLEDKPADLEALKEFCKKALELKNSAPKATIGIVGKYTEKHNAYLSLEEAILYSSIKHDSKIDIKWISSETLNDKNADSLSNLDGIIIPAGFGERGFSGKVVAVRFARENNIPTLMIGFGAQAGAIEFAKNVCGIADATSAEFNSKQANPLVKKHNTANGFKKGSHTTLLSKDSNLYKIYGKTEINERHRHKYEISSDYKAVLEQNGLTISGISKDGQIDAFELKDLDFFVGVAFRPEFSSRPATPNPLINAFITKVLKK